MIKFSDWFVFIEAEAAVDFEPLADTLGIPRNQMPQIKSDFVKKFFKHLQKNGIGMMKASVLPSQLSPTQDGVDKNKSWKYIAEPCDTGLFDKRILVSKDMRILDGHHHWHAMLQGFPNRPMKVFVIGAPIAALLQLSKTFSKTKYQDQGI